MIIIPKECQIKCWKKKMLEHRKQVIPTLDGRESWKLIACT